MTITEIRDDGGICRVRVVRIALLGAAAFGLPWSDRMIADAHGSKTQGDAMTIGPIAVADQVIRRLVPCEGFGELWAIHSAVGRVVTVSDRHVMTASRICSPSTLTGIIVRSCACAGLFDTKRPSDFSHPARNKPFMREYPLHATKIAVATQPCDPEALRTIWARVVTWA